MIALLFVVALFSNVFTTEDGNLRDECSTNCFETYPDSDFESCF